MIALCQFLAVHGGALLAGATCLLALGCVLVGLQRAAIHRQRASQMTMLGVLLWLILACVPLPRVSLPESWLAEGRRVDSPAPAAPAQSRRVDSAPREEIDWRAPPVSEPVDAPVFAGGASEEILVPGDEPRPAETDVPAGSFSTVEETSATASAAPAGKAARVAHEQDRPSAVLPRRAATASPAGLDVRDLLAASYVAGVLACLGWLALGRLLLLRVIRSASVPAPWLQELYEGLPFAGGRLPRLLISDRCRRAVSFGLWRPTVVVPQSLCRPDRTGPLRHVLRHELAHISQRDASGRFLFNLAFPVLYFHPLYWWLRSRAALAAELIADDSAARHGPKESYVEALIALAKEHGLQQAPSFGLQGLFGSQSQFYRRMQMLVNRESRLASRCSRRWRWVYPAACFLAVALVASAVGVRSGRAQDASAPPDKKAADSKQKALLSEKDRAQLLTELDQFQQLIKQWQARKAQLEAEVTKARSDLEAKIEQLAAYQDQLRQLADKEEELRKRAGDAQAKAGRQVAESSRKAYEQLLQAVPGLSEAQAQTIPDHARAETPAAWQPPAVAGQPAVESLPFDLVNLAMAYADAVGDLELAEARSARLDSLRKSNVVSDEEFAIAVANLRTAKRKVDLLQGIGISAIKAIKVEVTTLEGQLQTLQKQPEQSSAVTAVRIRLARASSQLEILERILSSR
jgi:beta-lactamase regulating signal transducer with metallopeptidase domain